MHLVACSAAPTELEGGGDAITSNDADILDLQFEGEVIAEGTVEARMAIVSQIMYAQGVLTTAGHGNAQVGNVKLSDVAEAKSGNDKRISYKASLPVAWPRGVPIPTTYNLPLPLDLTELSIENFNEKYDGRCGTNEYGQSSFWHDWNPKAAGCTIDQADVMPGRVTVLPHAKATKNKYPEYDLIWQDDRLDVVAIFGIIESNTPTDDGYTEAARFVENSERQLADVSVEDNGSSPTIVRDTTIVGTATVGGRLRDVKIDVLVVRDLQYAGADFDERYEPLSEKADVILYNGHSGLSANINALARKGIVTAGKYQLVLLNGCQSFAYIDTTMTDRRRVTNGSTDPEGTKFLDVIGNALPGYSTNLAAMSNVIFNAVLRADTPKHYNDLLAKMPQEHIVVAFGEEDNHFEPKR